MSEIEATSEGGGLRVAVVVSRFNDFVTERLLAGATEALAHAGVARQDLTVIKVPGAFEIPMAARLAATKLGIDAVVALGCLIRGETAHFEYIASAASHALMKAACETGVPMTLGILTTESAEQALARAGSGSTNKGWEAAMAAVEMANLFRLIDGQTAAGQGA
jgi:6,7-dimethyl-8-ribityllumazine synthase